MQNAETVLKIIHERGKQGLPLDEIYRQLYNPHLYIRAYDRIRKNEGAMTRGVTGETVDGMSMTKIGRIIEALRTETYRWKPARRVYIPKRNGKLRPLGMPTWSDKLVQEVMRELLEAYYEPQFSPHSHGFRPNRGCHTALSHVRLTWQGTRWFIEGDISQCFDRLSHDVLMAILGDNIHDNRFLRLIEWMLKAGYLEEWKWNTTYSGTPQGGVVSPILSNIYLDRLDKYVERRLFPEYNRKEARAPNRTYEKCTRAIAAAKKRGDRETVRELSRMRRTLPASDPNDPEYRRLRYVRYADDFLLGFCGPRAEAEVIKTRLREFLHDELKLELSEEKTLITHAVKERAHFLSYEIRNQQDDGRIGPRGDRSLNGALGLTVPQEVVERKCAMYMKNGEPVHRRELTHESDYSIIRKYQAEYRGVVSYYKLAHNLTKLGHVHHIMKYSLLKTLANKHKATVREIARKYAAYTDTEQGKLRCLRVVVPRGGDKEPLVAEFGGIALRRNSRAILPDTIPNLRFLSYRTDVVERMMADTCEVCGAKGDCEVHHVRKLADLHIKGRREKPAWMRHMIAMRRKTLVVCHACHRDIHNGWPLKRPTHGCATGELIAGKPARSVRRGGDGKGS